MRLITEGTKNMAKKVKPIKTSVMVHKVIQEVSDASETIINIQKELNNLYEERKQQMGESPDLLVFEQKYYAEARAVARLGKELDDFAQRMAKIEKNYRTAQENAIRRAMMIE